MIHGGIDGASRKVVFLDAADNNLSQTVLNRFTGAVHNVGNGYPPLRVRVDLGVENRRVSM